MTTEQVLVYLTDHGPATVSDIVSGGEGSEYVRLVLNRLWRRGEVVRAGARAAVDVRGNVVGGRQVVWALPCDAETIVHDHAGVDHG